jgi:hypothetical protein
MSLQGDWMSGHPVRVRAWFIRIPVAAAILCGGIYAGVWLSRDGGTPERRPPASAVRDGGASANEALPASGRLRAAAQQIREPAAARQAAREALARVDAELAAAKNEAETSRLLRKRDLVLQALARLGEPESP